MRLRQSKPPTTLDPFCIALLPALLHRLREHPAFSALPGQVAGPSRVGLRFDSCALHLVHNLLRPLNLALGLLVLKSVKTKLLFRSRCISAGECGCVVRSFEPVQNVYNPLLGVIGTLGLGFEAVVGESKQVTKVSDVPI